MRRRKSGIRIAALLLAAVLLVGCGGTAGQRADAAQAVLSEAEAASESAEEAGSGQSEAAGGQESSSGDTAGTENGRDQAAEAASGSAEAAVSRQGETAGGQESSPSGDTAEVENRRGEAAEAASGSAEAAGSGQSEAAQGSIAYGGSYTSKEDVALYLYTYGELPPNFITKNEARSLGWSGGGLEDYAPGMCIGGDYFGNYEGLLPEGHSYRECDIDTLGQRSRGAKRIIYSTDGLIYYTADHYESYTLLYGTP